jgi:hypothetical protein
VHVSVLRLCARASIGVEVTEQREDVAQAAAAQAAGAAAVPSWTAHAEAMLRIEGGGVDVTDSGRSLDDQAVPGIGSS